jgi:hypothetical protein
MGRGEVNKEVWIVGEMCGEEEQEERKAYLFSCREYS